MTDSRTLLDRIVFDPKVMVGKPVIRGTRLTVHYILGLLASGLSTGEIVKEYPGLIPDDVAACLLFASEALEHSDFLPITSPVA